MDAPPVRYVTTSDGFSIAYAVSGQGRPFVLLPGAFEHVQLAWQYPRLAPWLEGLAARFQLIQIDARGAGMSTRGLTNDLKLEDYQRDLEAVVDHLNPPPFVLYATTYRIPAAVQFTLSHADRIVALVMGPGNVAEEVNTFSTAFFETLPHENWDMFLRSLASIYQEPGDIPKSVALLKQAFDQDDFAQIMRVAGSYGVPQEDLSHLRTPTLVLRPRDYFGNPNNSTKMAQLARATFSVIDGAFALGDAEQGIRAIEAFLADLAPADPAASATDATPLSSREVEVLRLVAAGKSNQQIADDLVISPNTVGRHVSNIFDKVGAANRVEAAAYAQRHGLA
jgi:DNA-binding CsgD family transcriptional regulator/pimeloyl-ACP methyl ester carboxylesterase